MNIEIIIIGDELLDGRVADTHTATLGRCLNQLGLSISRQQTLPDRQALISEAVVAASERASLCVITGGLGPTSDDLTVAALADAAQQPLVEDAEAWQRIVERYRPALPPETNRKQALRPEGATALLSEVGTAPALHMTLNGCEIYALPGVPQELAWHLETYLRPALSAHKNPTRATRTLSFVSLGESTLAEGIQALDLPATLSVGYRAHAMGVDVRLSGDGPKALDAVNHAAEAIIARFPDAFLSDGGEGLPAALLRRLKARGLTVGTAESCTGGLVGAALTAIPGSSAVVAGGIISYSNAVKQRRLGVSEEILSTEGAVSEACAAAMARGARAALGCDVALSITGIAGPGGGSPEKPVGTVCFGWSGPDFERTQTHRFRGDRETVRRRSVAWALAGLWREVGR